MKILIIEDEARIAQKIAEKLESFGYEITDKARSYEEALASFKKDQPDLAICDIKIHGYRDGIQTAEAIRQIKDIPIIFLTAYFDEELRRRVGESRPANYLIKPVDFKQLEVAVELALSNAPGEEKDEDNTPPSVYIQENNLTMLIDGVFRVLPLDEILYLEADNVATKLVTLKKVFYLASKTLKKTLSEMAHPDIIRVSRSHAINIRKIREFDRKITYIVLDKEDIQTTEKIDQVVFVTDHYRDDFRKKMGL